MSICRHCGCDKPCPCDGYSGDDSCQRCGCSKPCACDGYSQSRDHTSAPLSSSYYENGEPEDYHHDRRY